MPISEQLRALRAKVGRDLLMLPAVTGFVFDEAPIDALDLAPWARIMLPAAFANRGRSLLPASTWTPPR